MKKVIIDMDELSDSREIYMSKPSMLIVGFVYVLIGIIILSIIYVCFAKIDIYVTAKGVIRPNDDIATVSASTTGKIKDVYFSDGEYVNEGDILFIIDTQESEITLAELYNAKKECEYELKMLQEYLVAIDEGVNPFNPSIDSDEYRYYVSFADYLLKLDNSNLQYLYDKNTNNVNLENLNHRLSQINYELSGLYSYKNSILIGENLCSDYPRYDILYREYAEELNSLTNEYISGRSDIQLDATASTYRVSIEYYNAQINGYNNLINSISDGVDHFSTDDDSPYSLMYKNFLDEIRLYEEKYSNDQTAFNQAVENYKTRLLSEYIASRDELASMQSSLQLQLSSVKDVDTQLSEFDASFNSAMSQRFLNAIVQIDTQVSSLEMERQSVESGLKLYRLAEERYSSSLSEDGLPIEISLFSIEHTLSILNSIESCEEKLESVKCNIERTEELIADGKVVATKSGYINMISTPMVGELISSGTDVATIIPLGEGGYKVQMYVGNSDIAGIDFGDIVRYNITALPYNRYGVVDGTVIKVSGDTIYQNGEYSGYFLVEGSIPDDILYDYEGNEGEIGVGMEVVARIVIQRKTIIRYLLEKINLF